MNSIRAFWRLCKGVWVFVIELSALVIHRPHTRPERAAWLSGMCLRFLRYMDIHVFTHGPVPMQGAVISNHLHFLDILGQASLRPCVFVANSGVRKLPVLGWISMMAGTTYVQRGAGHQAQHAAETMAKAFRDGLPIVYFPEGTTGPGDPLLLPFKSGLIAQTLEAQQPMTPGFLRYVLAPEDIAAGRTPQRDIYWTDQTLPQLIWRLCQLHRLELHIRFAEHAIEFSAAALADRKIAAVEAREAMLRLTEPVEL